VPQLAAYLGCHDDGQHRQLQELAARWLGGWALFASDKGGYLLARRQSATNNAVCNLALLPR